MPRGLFSPRNFHLKIVLVLSTTTTYLIEIRLQIMHLLALLQQARPVLLLELLLPQQEAHVGAGGMRLGVLDIDLAVELELDVIGGFFGFAVAGEDKAVGFQIDGGLFGISRADGEGDVVPLRVAGGRALSPEN